MPIRYEVEDETGIVVATSKGLITPDEWRAHVDRMRGDPALKRPLRVLDDIRMRESVPSVEELQSAVAYVSAELFRGSRGRLAFVVSEAVFYGIGRMAEVFIGMAGATKARVFYDIEEAREWLLGEEAP